MTAQEARERTEAGIKANKDLDLKEAMEKINKMANYGLSEASVSISYNETKEELVRLGFEVTEDFVTPSTPSINRYMVSW